MKQYNEDQMKLFVKRREEDLTVNQKRMINSIVDREMRTITIDRLVKEVDNDQFLVTDPQEIMNMTNDHFQKCPGAVHTFKDIPDDWIPQFQPKSYVDESIYSQLSINTLSINAHPL